jgi:hypothetical protein
MMVSEILPGGYGENRITLLPRESSVGLLLIGICPTNRKKDLRRQGGQQLALRLYDVTDIDLNSQGAHSVQEYLCDELAGNGIYRFRSAIEIMLSISVIVVLMVVG